MHKILCLLFAFLLCFAVAAAETIPSKSTADLTEVKDIVAEYMPEDSNFTITAEIADEVVVEATNTEIAKLADAADVETYFGEVKDLEGNVVSLKEMLKAETIQVNEFVPVVVNEYKEEYGKVSLTMNFATPYAKGETVLVLVGLVEINEAGEQVVTWTVLEGATIEDGSIHVEFDKDTLIAMQNGTVLVAVVSK